MAHLQAPGPQLEAVESSDWYQRYLVDTDRSATLWVVAGFVITYAATRWITLRIRARTARHPAHSGSAVKDVYIGGVHIHHQVWGILLVLVVGLLEFRFSPQSPWHEVLAALFGAGAALALDEFALWLHLQDVYWTEEGRKSIDAVMVACVIGLALLASTSPFGVDPNTVVSRGLAATSIGVVFHISYTIICLLKGKIATGLISLPIPLERAPNATEAVWELAEHRYLYIEVLPERAGHALPTVFVDDLDERIERISARGIEPASRETYRNGVRR